MLPFESLLLGSGAGASCYIKRFYRVLFYVSPYRLPELKFAKFYILENCIVELISPGESPGLANGLLISLKPPIILSPLLNADTLSDRSRHSLSPPLITRDDLFLIAYDSCSSFSTSAYVSLLLF